MLTGLITGEPRWVLDLGAGEGALARPLAARAGQVDRVDAVEISAAMIETGRRRPGGDSARLRWLAGAAETVPLPGRYALVTAGASLHWMDWAPVLRRAGQAMTPGAELAIVELSYGRLPWHDELQKIIARHSWATGYDRTSRCPANWPGAAPPAGRPAPHRAGGVPASGEDSPGAVPLDPRRWPGS